MSFVLITADFPGIRAEEMHEVSNRLEQGHWEKMHNHTHTMNTSWLATFAPEVPEREAIKNAQDTFMACCSPYCRPIMVLQHSQARPVYPVTK